MTLAKAPMQGQGQHARWIEGNLMIQYVPGTRGNKSRAYFWFGDEDGEYVASVSADDLWEYVDSTHRSDPE